MVLKKRDWEMYCLRCVSIMKKKVIFEEEGFKDLNL